MKLTWREKRAEWIAEALARPLGPPPPAPSFRNTDVEEPRPPKPEPVPKRDPHPQRWGGNRQGPKPRRRRAPAVRATTAAPPAVPPDPLPSPVARKAKASGPTVLDLPALSWVPAVERVRWNPEWFRWELAP